MTRRPSPPNEVQQAVAKVFGTPERSIGSAYQQRSSKPIKPTFAPNRLELLARRMDGFSCADLAARSPIKPDDQTPADVLYHLYEPGEQILIFTKFQSHGQVIATRPEPHELHDSHALDGYIHPQEGNGAWFLCNPIDGQWRNIDRLKSEHNPTGRTRRAEENLTAFRYLVIESNQADPAQWIAGLVQMPLPIVAVYSSGGKSIHALVRVAATSGHHWRKIKAKLAPALVTLGADDAAMTAVRLTRLPQCFRAEKNRRQELFYLNPGADEMPISQLPKR